MGFCTRCRQTLPADQFRRNVKMWGGLHSWCKPCTVAGTREWRARHREAILAKRRAQYAVDPETDIARRMRRYRNENPLTPKTCQTCGDRFTPEQTMGQKHCSVDCYARDRRKTRRGVPKYWRRKILARDNWTCYLCGGAIPEWVPWPHQLSGTVDHVIPWKHGGKGTLDNLRAAHWHCNRRKAASLLEVA